MKYLSNTLRIKGIYLKTRLVAHELWHLYEHIQCLVQLSAMSTMYGYVFMAYISNVNREILLNFYFWHRLWAGL